MARLTDQALDFIRTVMGRAQSERKDAFQPRTSRARQDSLYPSLFSSAGERSIEEVLRVDQDLMSRFVDYEHMDQYPELGKALDIYADDATQPDTMSGRTVQVESDDQEVRDTLEELFYERLTIDEHIWEIARSLTKYGNNYEELLCTDRGVIGMQFVSAPSVRRIETQEDGLLGFVQDPSGQFRINPEEFKLLYMGQGELPPDTVLYDDWQVVHMRLRSIYRSARYGFSILEPARWIWKRLVLLEDSLMVYKLSRAPSRYAFYVDVGRRAPREAIKYLTQVKQQFKKKKFVDPKTGQLDLRFNPLGMDEDIFIPVIDGQDAARIEVLTGPSFQSTEEVDYFLRKLFAAIGVPKMYLGFSEERAANSILSNVDVQFARSVLRLQRELRNGLRKIARVHMSCLGIDPSSAYFDLYLTIPSGIYQIAQMEVETARADLAGRLKEFYSLEWILAEVFGHTTEEIQTIKSQREAEAGAVPGGAPVEGFSAIGNVLREEAREARKISNKDSARMHKKLDNLMKEDKTLRGRLTEIDHLLREFRTMRAMNGHRNGNGQGRSNNGRRLILDRAGAGL